MQSPLKSFHLETQSHTIATTYQPSHIDFRVVDKRTGHVQGGQFYDSTLPSNVREECEAVSDLYDYLQGKSASEMEVEAGTLKFKVVRIKKERWYALTIAPLPAQSIAQGRPDEEKMEEEEIDSPALVSRSEELRLRCENQELRQEVARLQDTTQELRRRLESNDLQVLIESGLVEVAEAAAEPAESPLPIVQPIPEELPLRRLALTLSHASSEQYSHEKEILRKASDKLSAYVFQECIRRGQKVYFSVQLQADFSYFIFGVTTEQHKLDLYPHFKKGCIAYCASLPTVFNETDTIDVDQAPREGDTVQLQLNSRRAVAEWSINSVLICEHRISTAMWEQDLFPFVVLARSGNAVAINPAQ